MKIFSSGTSEGYSGREQKIRKNIEDFYHDYSDKNREFTYEADVDLRVYAGDKNIWNYLFPNTPVKRRNYFNFNRVHRIVEVISGHQRRNRMQTIVNPVENSDQRTSDQFSKVISHINRVDNVLETISSSFHDSLATGLNLLYLWNDYSQDPISGNLRVDSLSFNSFFIDPYFRKADLSDCNCIWKRSYLSKGQAISLYPDKKGLINDVCEESGEHRFEFMPEYSRRDNKRLLSYDEYYYLDSRPRKLLIDSLTGKTMEWPGKTDEGLGEYLRQNPVVSLQEDEVPTVRLAILLQGHLIYDGLNPLGIDKYPFVPVLANFNPDIDDYSLKFRSVVRDIRDAQYLYNRRKNIELDIVESQVTSGFIYKEGTLVNPDDIFLKDQGKGIALKKTAQMTDIVPIQAPQIPPSLFQLSEILGREMQEITGINEELLGSAVDDKAGILSVLRQGASLTTLQTFFDNLDRSQRLLGNLQLEAIQANYTPGKIQNIIEEQPSNEFYDRAFGRYDAAVTNGFNTVTQKAQEFNDLIRLKELGIPIPDSSIIEAATIQNKTKLMEQLDSEAQARQQQQQQLEQAQQQLQMAQTELARAKVQSDLSLAKERDSRVYSNIGLMEERQQEAEKDKTQSMLNLIKTLQEIDDVDIDQLIKLTNLSKVVETQSNKDKDVERLGSAIVTGATKEQNNAVNTQEGGL